jgi:hypothetical protein
MANYAFRLDVAAGPVDGNLFVEPQVQRLLGDDFVEGVDGALRFTETQRLTVMNAQGRNYYIPLPDAIGPYNAIRVAGGGNFDLGITTNSGVEDSIITPISTEDTRIVVPPSEGSGLFTGQTMFYEDGQCVVKENINPVGSYTSRSAGHKIDRTMEAFAKLTAIAAGVIAPMYAGKFEYDVPDQFGDPQTAILMLVPSYGKRFDAKLLLPLHAYLTGQGPAPGQEFTDRVKAFYEDSLMPRMSAIGSGISVIHAAGMVHHQLTGGNTDALTAPNRRLVPYITDWDTATVPNEADMPASQALDVALAIGSASAIAIRLFKLEAIDIDTTRDLILYTGFSILKGYLGIQSAVKLQHIDPDEIIDVASSETNADKKIKLVRTWVDS